MKSKLAVTYRNPNELKFDPNNTNTHTTEQIEEIVDSIREFEFVQPILLDEDGVLIAGEGRLKAALILELEEVPTITLDHLNHIQRRAYSIADNQLAKKSNFDQVKLLAELDKLAQDEQIRLSCMGFNEEEVTRLREMVAAEQEALLEAGKGSGESLDVAGESAGGSDVKTYVLRFGSRKIPMTEEEFRMIDEKYSEYVAEFGVPAGFASLLLGC
jgi:ParB-like chromosome segregation protein Spo0J